VKKLSRAVVSRLQRVRLAIFDVDGVLTDGRLYYSAAGEELKVFHTLDGHGMKMLAESGVSLAIISGRSSKALARRAADLGIKHVVMGAADKASAYRTLLRKLKLSPGETAAIGDDIVDLPILTNCAFSVAVPSAPKDVLTRVDHITKADGGRGAVREFCEIIMRAQGTYQVAVNKYLDS
jgi:3-deoxy-D-manno-octulosonate 8-phosphate phosphatase (KDO 8-P phosphatase)